ncbi:LOW QUALITY PROTEIN: zinc finger protein 772-like [Pipistrellus kuhlii]|uniref:LOW QUALITY PROTEIN: zinc finger protein 772-like n=1 Tax=Pipistrellus kuhlii TaxID=59472 RepID=UPI00174F211B|nr:LOW QUALITY PROTEIN: zinc finger protein 772-like [Pipistrellus kuhlii]
MASTSGFGVRKDMNFKDVVIAFSQEEWDLLDEAQRLQYWDVMLEVFTLVASIGKNFTSLQVVGMKRMMILVFMYKENHMSGLLRQLQQPRSHIPVSGVSVLKYILHLTKSQAEYLEHNRFFRAACVKDFCFSANPHQQQKDVTGEAYRKDAMDNPSFVTRCSFYLSVVPSKSREVGKDVHATSDKVLQPQASQNTEEQHSGSDISQEYLSGKSHHQWTECEIAASQTQKVVECQGVYSGELIYECDTCKKGFK